MRIFSKTNNVPRFNLSVGLLLPAIEVIRGTFGIKYKVLMGIGKNATFFFEEKLN